MTLTIGFVGGADFEADFVGKRERQEHGVEFVVAVAAPPGYAQEQINLRASAPGQLLYHGDDSIEERAARRGIRAADAHRPRGGETHGANPAESR